MASHRTRFYAHASLAGCRLGLRFLQRRRARRSSLDFKGSERQRLSPYSKHPKPYTLRKGGGGGEGKEEEEKEQALLPRPLSLLPVLLCCLLPQKQHLSH